MTPDDWVLVMVAASSFVAGVSLAWLVFGWRVEL